MGVTSESLVSRLVPLFLGKIVYPFSTLIGTGGFEPYETSLLDRSWKQTTLKKGNQAWNQAPQG